MWSNKVLVVIVLLMGFSSASLLAKGSLEPIDVVNNAPRCYVFVETLSVNGSILNSNDMYNRDMLNNIYVNFSNATMLISKGEAQAGTIPLLFNEATGEVRRIIIGYIAHKGDIDKESLKSFYDESSCEKYSKIIKSESWNL
ncbi:Uncharacterised protein [Shewanella baltica]|uniref:hypothetical protein n=1 Tax=Shewanella TaxID=22 RepID=UPI000F716FAD|nr:MULTISPECIES: hypothetical protein [Shewanella]MCK7635829.1 hypothetical protein [Shewanella sp. JNE17]MCK7651000.1 hypothetical protein [Shewanella sp. JNE8]MCK7659204.1 hypothetical protein [Shewanella sp. JNE4-2]UPO32571.1 hypothetical protein MZ182_06965 [Shewanella sp. JNE2]VEF26648.1 Uncharacterised protein [Shewanella baltica]